MTQERVGFLHICLSGFSLLRIGILIIREFSWDIYKFLSTFQQSGKKKANSAMRMSQNLWNAHVPLVGYWERQECQAKMVAAEICLSIGFVAPAGYVGLPDVLV